jgi:Zn-dependent protease
MSVVVHEVAHGMVAYYWGDNTAKDEGRLTLNPIKHLDLFGSVILPILLVLSQTGIVFGWAKPVPYNPHNLRDLKKGTLAVASAGIIANLILAIFFALVLRLAMAVNIDSPALFGIVSTIVLVNIVLTVFNLIPIPPLDGSKILFALLPYRYRHIEIFLEKYSLIILLAFIFFGWKLIEPVIFFITGILI